MQTFTDLEGRAWTVQITINKVKAVRAALDVDLLEAAGGNLFKELASDPVKVADILYVLCQGQHEGVTDTDFGAALAGDVLDNAVNAFFEGLVDFFPERQRQILRTILDKVTDLENKAIEIVQKRANSPELDDLVAKTINSQIDSKLSELGTTG